MNLFKNKKRISKLKLEVKQKKVGNLLDVMLNSNLDIYYSHKRDEYLILDKNNKITVCVSYNAIKIIKDTFFYEIPFSFNTLSTYIQKIKNKMEEKSDSIKKDLFKNEISVIEELTKLYD